MDKQELAERLARRSQQSRGKAADKLDDLIYKLWKESRNPKTKATTGDLPAASQAPAKKP
jgi:hypothetical protein